MLELRRRARPVRCSAAAAAGADRMSLARLSKAGRSLVRRLKGVGPSTATAMVNKLGEDGVLRALEEGDMRELCKVRASDPSPARCGARRATHAVAPAAKVPGIGPRKAQRMLDGWRSSEGKGLDARDTLIDMGIGPFTAGARTRRAPRVSGPRIHTRRRRGRRPLRRRQGGGHCAREPFPGGRGGDWVRCVSRSEGWGGSRAHSRGCRLSHRGAPGRVAVAAA